MYIQRLVTLHKLQSMATFNPDNPTSRKVARDESFDNTSHQVGLQTPIVDTSLVPSATNVNARNVHPKGKIATDRTDCCLYLSDGKQWNFVGGCAGTTMACVNLADDVVDLSTGQTVIFDTVEFDPSGIYSTTTGVFTIPATGFYEINATLCSNNFNEEPPVTYGVIIAVNGASESKTAHDVLGTPDIESENIFRKLSLTTGDLVTIRLAALGTSATVLGSTNIGGLQGSWASVRRIA